MLAAGQRQSFDLTEHAVVGFIEVLQHYWTLRQLFKRTIAEACAQKPDAIVFIDYPGFNLRVAAKLRPLLPDTKFIYYISPQLWAWKAGRVRNMARDLNLVLCLFPFEQAWYQRRAPELRAEWFGHPLLDRIQSENLGEQIPGRIALLPGSRRGEIKNHLPTLLQTARLLANRHSGLRFVILAPDRSRERLIRQILEQQAPPGLSFECYTGYQLSHLARSQIALVTSGTASLECAFVGVPQIVVYRVNRLTYEIGRRVIKVNYLSMVNVLAGQRVVPEVLQFDFTPAKLAAAAHELLIHPASCQRMQAQMAEVVAGLGGPGANRRAASAILQELSSQKISLTENPPPA